MPISAYATRLPRRFLIGLALYALVGGVVSFLGWPLNLARLTDWPRTGTSIQPASALAVTLAGASLLWCAGSRRRWSAFCGTLVAGLGLATLFQYVTGTNLGFESMLLFGREWGQYGVTSPGRMGLPGAVSFSCLGLALVASSADVSKGRTRAVAPALALLTAAVSGLSIIGYIYGASILYDVPAATVIALQTSTFILAVSAGVMLAVPQAGPARFLIEQSPAGILVRRFLPAVLVVPIVIGLLRVTGQRAGLYDLEFGSAIRTLAEIFLLLLLLWLTTRTISRQAHRREQAEQMVVESERRLRTVTEQTRAQLEADLKDSRLLQAVSSAISHEKDEPALYQTILDAAVSLARSQFGSMQMLHRGEKPEGTGRLKLLAFRGFPSAAAEHWEWVDTDTNCVCALALRAGHRIVIENVHEDDRIRDDQRAVYEHAGIVSVQSTPLVSRNNRILGMISTHWNTPHVPSDRELGQLDILARLAADLVERRQSEDALRHADRRKDEFLATLAHELRNPLAPVRSAVDLMEDRLPPEADLIWARGVIDRQVGLMSRLLDDLLDVGRIAQDRLELKKERLDLRAMIQTAAEISRPLIAGFKHELRLVLPDKPVFVDADPARLSQVFGNLLNNACRYTPPAGHISVNLESDNTDAIVRVRDSGIGLTAGEQSSIFEMFFQVDQSLERSQSGLGIGLHLARRLVQMHGGTIEAQSRGLGQGSEFIVRLPLASVETTTRPANGKSRSAESAASRRRILVVDDNIDAATSMSMLLSLSGHDTHVAHDGPSAVAAADQLRPDVILLDIGLPRMNGYDVCRRIRQEPWGRNVLIVAITGWGQELDRQRSEQAGFNHHLVKPVEHQKVLKLLASEPELV